MSGRRPGDRRSSKVQKRQRRQRLERARRGQQHPPKGPQPEAPEELDLVQRLERALDVPEPLDLLALVSALMVSLTPRHTLPFVASTEPDTQPKMTLAEFVDSFIDVDLRATTGALTVMAALTDDEMLAARVRRELERRTHRVPPWLRGLAGPTAYRAVEVVDVLGDGDDVIVGVRLGSGHELTALVYIDHNLGTQIKDAFFVPDSIGNVVSLMKRRAESPDTEWRDLALADARTRIEEADHLWSISYPPLESDSWPACRPLVAWVNRALPEGGAGYQRPEWSDSQLSELTEDFFTSRFGSGLDDADHRSLLESILWFGTDYGPGDPLRWSPVAVEMLLADWIPRKIVADPDFLSLAPDLLSAFVRYSHHTRGIRSVHTTETLDAVASWTPDYLKTIRSDRPQGPAALLAAMGVPWSSEEDGAASGADEAGAAKLAELLAEFRVRRIAQLEAAVGGRETLETLDTTPLPEEPFDWTGLPDDIHDPVRRVLDLVDAGCAEFLDVQARTGCRRLLARCAAGEPAVFRRRAAPKGAAAAICWIVARSNDLFDSWGAGLKVKQLSEFFDVATPSQRAGVLLKAAGIVDNPYETAVPLGSTDLLVSSRRAAIIKERDFLIAELGWTPDTQ